MVAEVLPPKGYAPKAAQPFTGSEKKSEFAPGFAGKSWKTDEVPWLSQLLVRTIQQTQDMNLSPDFF